MLAELHAAAPGIDLRQPVAYLDLGAGGYVDVGSSLSDEQLAELPKGRHMLGIIGTYGVDGYVPADSPKGGSDTRDAARWRYVRRKLCLTGNGDGTCGMQAINLPESIPGWPDTSDDVVGFCEAAIDAAMQAQAGDAEVQP